MSEKEKKKTKTASAKRRGLGLTVKLTAAVIISVMIAVSALLAVVYQRMSQTLLQKSEEMLHTTTEKTLQETKAWMNGTLAMMKMQRDTIEYENMDVTAIAEYVKHTAGQNEAYPAGLYVALTDGALYHASYVPGPDYSPLEKGWYLIGLESEEIVLSDVYLDEASQSYVVGASGMLRGPDGAVRGVAAADVNLDSISEIVSESQIEDNGGIFLVDTLTNTIIGHKDSAVVGTKLGESGGMYAYAEKQLQSGNTGLGLYKDTYVEIAEVEGSSWAAVAYVSKEEILSELYDLTYIMAVMSAAAVLVMTLLVVIQVRRIIGRPVKELSRAATRIAEGELDQTIRYKSRDELGILVDDFNQVTVRLKDYIKYINEISDTLREIARGNLAFELKNEYTGEFARVRESLEEIAVEFNMIMGQMRVSSRDVAAGAAQISGSAVNLSQGSAEQAAEVEALSGNIEKAADSVKKVAQGAQKASGISKETKDGLLESNTKMQNMREVIQRISEKSNAIHKIVKTIDDIAFQTNILALNAAVEAARAGESGKGFAVVAEEVRTLAGKSATAAQETTELLGETIKSMEQGVIAADDTAQSMLAAAEMAEEMDQLICGIADYTKQQADIAEDISHGIEQISIVVQSNVDTAESGAAASEELSGQAAALKELVSRFRLKE